MAHFGAFRSSRLRGFVLVPALYLGASVLSCQGRLVVTDYVSCVSSSTCAKGFSCINKVCVQRPTSDPGLCNTENTQGSCPIGRRCSAGVCLQQDDSRTQWCGCESDWYCQAGICTEGNTPDTCSPDALTGECTNDSVCVAGGCVPLSPTENGCSPARLNGLCPKDTACDEGYCIPIGDRPCNTVNVSGLCPMGQYCAESECKILPCSEAVPLGRCDDDFVCVEGDCTSRASLLSCADLGCASLNRLGCDDSGAEPVCLECSAGYHEIGGLCIPDTCADIACTSLSRICNDTGISALCTDCITSYTEDINSSTIPLSCRPKTCAELNCTSLQRECDDKDTLPSCGDCTGSLLPGPGEACVQATCASLDCAAQKRDCPNNGVDGCGSCLSDYTESLDGRCVLCETSAQCGTQQYCTPVGLCAQDCIGTTCADGSLCSPYGRCLPNAPTNTYCAVGIAEGERTIPTVLLLLDQSKSMTKTYGGTVSRWDAMDTTLFGTQGVVTTREAEVAFGMTLYTNNALITGCPNLHNVPAALNNRTPIKNLFDPEDPEGKTPTGDSIAAAVTELDKLTDARRKYIILATDGVPDTCAQPIIPIDDAGAAQAKAAARKLVTDKTTVAQNKGIGLFALYIGDADSETRTHMQEVANAGAGLALDGSEGTEPFFEATNPAQLSAALSDIIGSVLTCAIRLKTLGDRPVGGGVFLDGDAVPALGWRLTSDTTLELRGPYCERLKDGKPHFIGVRFDYCDGGG